MSWPTWLGKNLRNALAAAWQAFVAAVLASLSGHVAQLHAEKAELERKLDAQAGRLSVLSLNNPAR